jgi:hypothetical protein
MTEAELNALIAQFVADWGFSGYAENAEFEQDLRALLMRCGVGSPPPPRDAVHDRRPRRFYDL